MMNINDLPDLCLRTIFSKLPLKDLIRIDQVCPAWERIQSSVCLMRKELTILIGDEPERLFKLSSFALPYYDELLDNARKVAPESKDQNQLEFDCLDEQSAKLLTRLLPNITTFCLAIRYVIPMANFGEKPGCIKEILIDQVIVLLQKWSNKIQTLKLFVDFDGPTCDEKQLDVDLQKLFCTINSFQTLRHLTIKLVNGHFFGNYDRVNKPLDFLILVLLEEFYFECKYVSFVINDSLGKYARDAANLRAIAINGMLQGNGIVQSKVDLNKFLLYDKKLAEKFTQIPELEFREANFTMGKFCLHFNRLERLSIRIDSNVQKMYNLIKAIKPLKNLIYLEIDFRVNDEGEVNRRPTAAEFEHEIFNFDSIPQLPSVKIIKIFASLRSHAQLDSIQWDRMFTNLEILHYNSLYYDCSICKPKNNNDQPNSHLENEVNEDEKEKEKTRRKCRKLSLQAWKHCAKLHSVYSGDYGYSNVEKRVLDELYDRDRN